MNCCGLHNALMPCSTTTTSADDIKKMEGLILMPLPPPPPPPRSFSTMERGMNNKRSRTKYESHSECDTKVKRTKEQHKTRLPPESPQPQSSHTRRRSSARSNEAALIQLASVICESSQNVVFVTGAGLSVASGIRPFRSPPVGAGGTLVITRHATTVKNRHGRCNRSADTTTAQHHLQEGLWSDVIWTTATRASFRKDPAGWYANFWNTHFQGQGDWCGSSSSSDCTGTCRKTYKPNDGHIAINTLLLEFGNVKQITQNIDGLQRPVDGKQQLIEVHGRVGLYKCCPDSDSENDEDYSDDDDTDDERPVILGHRRKSAKYQFQTPTCPFRYRKSLTADQLVVNGVRRRRPLTSTKNTSESHKSCGLVSEEEKRACSVSRAPPDAPSCPACGNAVMPQALLFDEGYHSHSFYQFERAEDWLSTADVLVFVGTSFAVQLTVAALQHAREAQLPVYNFNLPNGGILTSTSRLNVSNIVGPASETLPLLVTACRQFRAAAAATPETQR